MAYWVSENYIKNLSTLDYNVDQKLIKPLILEVQKLRIRPILGTDLYNKIDTDIENTTTTTGNYLTLLDSYIAPTIRYWVLFESPLAITFKLRNNGALKQSNENGQPLSLQEIAKYEDRFRVKAEQYTQILEHWMWENCELFPELTSNTDDGDIYPGNNTTMFGMYLGKGKHGCDVYKRGYDKPY